jgi:hypothetical protein
MVAMSIAEKSAAITNRMAARPTAEPRFVRPVRWPLTASTVAVDSAFAFDTGFAFDSAARMTGAREGDV